MFQNYLIILFFISKESVSIMISLKIKRSIVDWSSPLILISTLTLYKLPNCRINLQQHNSINTNLKVLLFILEELNMVIIFHTFEETMGNGYNTMMIMLDNLIPVILRWKLSEEVTTDGGKRCKMLIC